MKSQMVVATVRGGQRWAFILAGIAAGLVSASAQVFTPSAENFTTHLLQEVTRNETPQASDVSAMVGALPNAGGNNTQGRTAIASLAVNSTQGRTALVTDLYSLTVRRAPDQAGLSFMLGALGSGTPESSLLTMLQGSTEYFTTRAASGNSQWLTEVYADTLHRAVDPAALSFWGIQLGSGMTRDQVASAIITSTEGRTVWVNDLANDYLHREADAVLKNAYAVALGSGTSQAAIRATFLGSGEFYNIEAHVTPVPEPQAFASIAGLGLLALAGWRQRRLLKAAR